MSSPESENGIVVAVPQSAVTYRRKPAAPDVEALENAGVPRANLAVSAETPGGTAEQPQDKQEHTVLQQHVMFWDRNGDGMITPADVWTGFRDLGFTVPICLLACTLIPLNFSYPTRLAYSYLPDPLFRIYVGGIHKAKHGSDSGVFDTEGRFVPQKFEDLFAACGRGDGTLTLGELFNLMQRNRVAADPFGAVASWFEWVTTWLLLQRSGRVHKEDLRRAYDGSLFYKVREERHARRDKAGGGRIGIDTLVAGMKAEGRCV